VTKVHVEVAKMRAEGMEIVMIGHHGHPEVEGTMGQSDDGMYLIETIEDIEQLQVRDPNRLAYVTQTTLSVDDTAGIIDALKRRFPNVAEPKKSDICYATTNRQQAVKFMAPQVDLLIVVGSPSSSNSSRLREVAEKNGVESYMVDDASQIDAAWTEGKIRIGVTAGASAPEVLVQQVITRLRAMGAASVRELDGVQEHVTFPLPKGLSARPEHQ
jgi:4-hydroxy-3-methylbut-2-enyl diphosphate reductase